MDRLHGLDSLDVVYRRFSDGVEVVRCVLEFCKEVGDVEQSYSNSMHKLLRSSSYTLHSNIIMQWLGGDPFQEIGTLKHCWQKLGSELFSLAGLHSEKATAYLETVRQPLIELMPQLEETRRELKTKIQMLRINLEIAEKKYLREKQKYFQLGDSYGKLKEKVASSAQENQNPFSRLESRLSSLRRDVELQECVYKDAHTTFGLAQESFNAELTQLYKMIQEKELERVKTLKKSLQEFAKTLSNTAPAYLEGMQKIVISVDEIDGSRDIDHFVRDHQNLLEVPTLPDFSLHQSREGDEGSYIASEYFKPQGASLDRGLTYTHDDDSLRNGDRTASPIMPAAVKEVCQESHREGDDSGNRNEKEQESENVSTMTRKKETQNGRSSFTPKPSTKKQTETKSVDRRPKPMTKPAVQGQRVASNNESLIRGTSPITTNISSSTYTSSTSTGSMTSSSSSSRVASVVQKIETPHPQTIKQTGLKSRALNPSSKPNVVRSKPQEVGSSKPAVTGKYSSDHQTLLQPRTRAQPTATLQSQSTSVTQYSNRPVQHPQRSVPATRSRLTRDQGDVDPNEFQLLSRLQQCTANCDYYELFGVKSDASVDDIAKARREKSREFHPDHYGNDPERRSKAEDILRRINQVYQDVLKTQDKRTLYDQLCRFRTMYPRIVHQQTRGLETAQTKLTTLQKAMKKAQLPLEVQDEIQIALNLIKTRIDNLSEAS